MIEQTFVMIKPDGVNRKLSGELIKRFEQRGLKIVAMKMVWPTEELARKHYTYEDIEVRHGKKIRDNLVKFITEGPVIAFILEGAAAIENVRKICGSTAPQSALPGTIRGDMAHHGYATCDSVGMAIRNVIHASANREDAKREIQVWFKPEEIHKYYAADEFHHYGPQGFK